jgi:2-polyprenyl-6-methoxyphenol hydroxylase-like FAD-dependent oxidoreductase
MRHADGMTYDVVVAGAGPVGLMVAGELALRGATVLVIERLTEPDLTIKAGSITVPTAEAFDRRGLLPEMRASQELSMAKMREFVRSRLPPGGPPANGTPARFLGHFGGIMLSDDRLDPAAAGVSGHGAAETVSLVGQAEIERILAERAAKLGVQLWRGAELADLDQDGDGVRAHLRDGRSVESKWLVGADGGRSVVRRAAGFDFPGTDAQITGHQAVVEMDGTDGLRPGWNATATGVYAHGPTPGRILTVEFDGPPADRDAPVHAAELQASMRHVSGVEVTVHKVLTATRFTDHARQASTYRIGRVLLAGDAAHVHSPFGGQGLNLGIGDAMNLGWKLAAELHDWAPPGLLDTYTAERHPIGAWVLDWTRAQIAIMRPDPYARALRHVVADLAATTDGTTYLATCIAGVRQRYDLPGDSPLVGLGAPDPELAAHLRDGRGVLVGAAAKGYADRLHMVEGSPAMLVRPDGIVAWVEGDGSLDEALRTWFGQVRVAA